MDTDDIDDIDVFLSVIDTLIENHSQKIICCVDDPIWKEQRLIPNLMYYSPRLQQLILNNQEFEPTFYDDLFFKESKGVEKCDINLRTLNLQICA